MYTFDSLYLLNSSTFYWIGLQTDSPCDDCRHSIADAACLSCRDGFYWLDGKSFSDFQIWDEDDPNGNDGCGILQGTGIFADIPCGDTLKFICRAQI